MDVSSLLYFIILCYLEYMFKDLSRVRFLCYL
nr:MAG TPA: hypothetical protein [Caudoviricetes sp.]